MSFETPEQKLALEKLRKAANICQELEIKYGKALSEFNQAYGREEVFVGSKRQVTSSQIETRDRQAKLTAKHLRAVTLSRLTMQEIRDARMLPQEIADRGQPTDTLLAVMGSVEAIEAALDG